MRSDNLAPPVGLSPFEQLIVAAAIHLGKRRERITPEALAELVGLPVSILQCMYWKLKPVDDAAACSHDPAFDAMETARCAYCGEIWP